MPIASMSLHEVLQAAVSAVPAPPGVTYAQVQMEGMQALSVRDVRLGELGRIILRVEAGVLRLMTAVAGEPGDAQTSARLDAFKPIAEAFMKHFDAPFAATDWNLGAKGRLHAPTADIAAQQVPCKRCGAIVALLIHADDARNVGGLNDYARRLHNEIARLNVPTWVLGPALGGGPIRDRPSDMMKVWPTIEPVVRQPPAALHRILDRLILDHC